MMEYKVDFLIGILSVFIQQFASIFFIKVVFDHIETLKGWNFYQILLIYGIAFAGRAIHHIFFDNLWTIGWQYIRTGNFEDLFVCPLLNFSEKMAVNKIIFFEVRCVVSNLENEVISPDTGKIFQRYWIEL